MTDRASNVIEQLQVRIQELEAQLVDRQSQIERLTANYLAKLSSQPKAFLD